MSEVGGEQANCHSGEDEDFQKPQSDPAITGVIFHLRKVCSVHGGPVASSGLGSALMLNGDSRSANVVSEQRASVFININLHDSASCSLSS